MISSFGNLAFNVNNGKKNVVVNTAFPSNIQVLGNPNIVFPAGNSISTTPSSNLYGVFYYQVGTFYASSSSTRTTATMTNYALNISETNQMWNSTQSYVPWTAVTQAANMGDYTGTVSTTVITNGTSAPVLGEWLQVQTPFAFHLTYFQCFGHSTRTGIAGPTSYSKTFIIVGSNDGIIWNYLTTINAASINSINTGTTLTNNVTTYSYYRFIITQLKCTAIGDNYAIIGTGVGADGNKFFTMMS